MPDTDSIDRAGSVQPRFLLMKRGLYYRPENRGYTGIKDHAGRYLQSDAYEGVAAIHEDEAPEFSPACFYDLREDHLFKQRAALRAALQDIADAEAIPNDAVAFVWCRDVARAALNPAAGEGARHV